MKKFIYFAVLCCMAMVVSCSEDEVKVGYDPAKPSDASKPVTFESFSPDGGGIRTRMFIKGSNFGTDPDLVEVRVGGEKANIVTCTPNEIYVMVPRHSASEDCDVKVTVFDANHNPVGEPYVFEKKFAYAASMKVGTLLRKVDEYGEPIWQEGSFDVAGVPSSDWLVFDPAFTEEKRENGEDQLLFSSNFYDGMRLVNITQREVVRLFPRTSYACMYSFTFSCDGDTLFFPDDNGRATELDKANIYYSLRKDGFTKFYPYNYGPCSYGMVCMPDGYKFYSSWTQGAVHRMGVPTEGIPHTDVVVDNMHPDGRVECFRLSALFQTSGQHLRMVLHPSNKFMYIFAEGCGAILKSEYDETEHMFQSPTLIAGNYSDHGCQEGAGSSARFDSPWAGIFVKNNEYVAQGKEDEYDFILSDRYNHCIWKITPEGVATIMAGRSNYTADNSYKGYIDGDPLNEARFNCPAALAYDPVTEVWYIGDIYNYALRYMQYE